MFSRGDCGLDWTGRPHPDRSDSGVVKTAVDVWTTSAQIVDARVFRSINKAGKIWGDGMTPKVIWEIVKEAAGRASIEKLAPHDLRRQGYADRDVCVFRFVEAAEALNEPAKSIRRMVNRG